MRKFREKGFSLIEFLIVIAVIAILVGIAAPNYLRWRATTITAEAAQQFARDIDRQRTETKRTNEGQTVNVSVSASTSYELASSSGNVVKYLPGGTQLIPIQPTDAGRNIGFTPPYGTTGVALRKYEVRWTTNPAIKRIVHVVGVTGKVIVK